MTLIPFHRAILATEQWRRAETCRDLVGDKKWLKSLAPPAPDSEAPRGPSLRMAKTSEVRVYKVEVDGRLHEVKVIGAAPPVGSNSSPPAGLHGQAAGYRKGGPCQFGPGGRA